MTYLRSVWPVFDDAIQVPRVWGVARKALQLWRALETRRARRDLMQLDDHLLKDIGLNRTDVRFGDLEELSQQRRLGRCQ